MQSSGESIRSIARILGRSPSTISRELNRTLADKFRGNYIASTTHARVQELWKKPTKEEILYYNSVMSEILLKISAIWLFSSNNQPFIRKILLRKVSHETLYIYIYSSPKGLKRYLLRRKQGRKSKKNNRFSYIGNGKNIPNRIDVSLRDELANKRLEFGHFEADSVVSCACKGKTKACLTVLVDRATRYTLIRKTASKTAQATSTSIVAALKPFKNNINSITYDNGCEFSKHEKLTKT